MGAKLANKLYIKVPYMYRGKLKYRKVQNIGKRNGAPAFLVDQQYAFQCAPLGDTEESMTVIRMTIPAGTYVEDGYTEILRSLRKMGYENPKAVCHAMGFDEIANYDFCPCDNAIHSCSPCPGIGE